MSDAAPSPNRSAAPEREPGVHRLVDMLVEEVSLVDRPANKQRFLVVKRESEMPKKNPDQTPGATADEKKPKGKKPKPPFPKEKAKKPTPPAKDPADEEEEEDDEEEEPGKAAKGFPPKKDPDEEEDDDQDEEPADAPAAEDKPTGKKPPKKRARKDEEGELGAEPAAGPTDDETPDDDETPLGIALAALDSLTQAVEILSDSPDDGSQLASVAQDIRDAADAISTAAGIEAEEEEDEGEGGGPASVARLASSIQEMLERIDSLTQALSASSKTPAAAPTVTTETQAPPDMAGTLAEVAQSMKSLDATVRAQAARLETLEKRAGVPNSQPAGERVSKREPAEDLSWPMDMNRPRDRASVNKDVSFHGERA